ncbi:hypothetical protein CSKR_111523 [Clonorchis sinensis]|uniref:Uncharacterized protein n=1 Tax=Clonorchis sinensis TaxID=79923 RepID=A0A3R7GJ53_CLOSI|nr:hypothetical protein CSKR_111523 [Clonorchis sinensis]
MQANATKRLHQFRNRSHFSRDAKRIYEKTYYSHLISSIRRYTQNYENTITCKQIWFCERLNWNPAESLVCDVSRQLSVLHQAASYSSCYDIRNITIPVYT